MKENTRKTVWAALCLALAIVLPFLTGQIPQIGGMLSPMHLPVFLCGFACGWQWGIAVGVIAPLMRSMLFGMPPMFPSAVAMALELAAYGFLSGFLYRKLPKKPMYIYVALIAAMLFGRIVWGLARLAFAGLQATEFTLPMFLAGAVTNAVPGILVNLILTPILVRILERTKLIQASS